MRLPVPDKLTVEKESFKSSNTIRHTHIYLTIVR